jgi:hypothetical protein
VKPSTNPIVDQDGRIIAEGNSVYYLAHTLENGDEWCQLRSNALWHICDAAERRSIRDCDPKDGLVVRADRHEAIFYYKAGEGLQEGWKEDDPAKVARRQAAYESGERIVRYSGATS